LLGSPGSGGSLAKTRCIGNGAAAVSLASGDPFGGAEGTERLAQASKSIEARAIESPVTLGRLAAQISDFMFDPMASPLQQVDADRILALHAPSGPKAVTP
jgi:hypothetical protein